MVSAFLSARRPEKNKSAGPWYGPAQLQPPKLERL